jgi:hypothetical protein
MDFDNFIYHQSKVPSDPSKRHLFFEELRKQFYEELKASEVNSRFFSNCTPSSVEAFLLNYAERKAYLAQSYTIYSEDIYRIKDMKHRSKAEKVFKFILHKKLFNEQCVWRAEQSHIEGILVSSDFIFYYFNIDSCPFLPEVERREVEVLKQFVADHSFENFSDEWLYHADYNYMMAKDEEGNRPNMTEWYEYYDMRMGTGGLLYLPDKRGEKEIHYMRIAQAENNRKYEEQKKTQRRKPAKPSPKSIVPDHRTLFEYAREFESDPHFVELFRGWQEQINELERQDADEDGNFDQALTILQEATEPIYLEGGLKWKDAIVRAGNSYINNIIYRQLDYIYDEYLTLRSSGLSVGKKKADVMDEMLKDQIVVLYRDQILRGRELAGEPRDFNF